MNSIADCIAALRSRFVHLVEALTVRLASLGHAVLDRARALVAHPVGAVAGLVADGLVPPVALAGVVLIASAGLVASAGVGVSTQVALSGLRHLAAACVFDVVLRHLPRHHLVAAGRRLRTAAAVGLLWLAAASFNAGWTVAPRPVALAAVPGAALGGNRPVAAAAIVPGIDEASTVAEIPLGRRAGRGGRSKTASQGRA